MYGLIVESMPRARQGDGVVFGLAVWMAGIPTALQALNLAAPAHRYSREEHAFGLASHMVFGLVAEYIRRKLRSWL
jgi:putative membrane protein